MDFMTPEGGAGLGVLYLLRAMGMTVLAGLFLCAFLYIACSQNSGIQEPILSVQLPYSQQKMTKRPTNRSDTLSLSFFGWKWELSIETMQQLSDQLSRWYRQYGVLIPARYRAAASAAVILWEELSKISREIFTTPFC